MRKLLVVDLQKQFADKNNECKNYQNCLKYIKNERNNYNSVMATLFRQDDKNKNFIERLNWDGCSDSSREDLEFPVADEHIIIKNGYGIQCVEKCFSKDDEIDVIGCDSDACVMAICFQLWDAGIRFNVLSDYIYTTSKAFGNDAVIEMMRRNFGSCVK